jgi:hypothetical protein
MQRIQTNAECIVLYGSQRVELKYIERLISNIRNSMLIGSIGFALTNFPIQLLSKSKTLFLINDINEFGKSLFSCSQRNVYIRDAYGYILFHSKYTKSTASTDIFG